jgi:hypothetical protein
MEQTGKRGKRRERARPGEPEVKTPLAQVTRMTRHGERPRASFVFMKEGFRSLGREPALRHMSTVITS